jgi:peptide-methionine (S)-S-oxide reductase
MRRQGKEIGEGASGYDNPEPGVSQGKHSALFSGEDWVYRRGVMRALLPTLIFGLLAMTLPAAETTPASIEKITMGGGCFWCVEAVFQRIKGVKSVASGYAGGTVENPTYKQVCTGETGHAEVIQLTFDPGVVSFERLLDVFWAAHDPTTLNQQGADRGTQYRSVIFYENDRQKELAEKSKDAAQKGFQSPIVTQIAPMPKFYKAEDYHQNYYNENKNLNRYCTVVISPKLQKLLQKGLIEESAGK